MSHIKKQASPKNPKKMNNWILIWIQFLPKPCFSFLFPWTQGDISILSSQFGSATSSLPARTSCHLFCPIDSHIQCGSKQRSIKTIYSELATATITKGVSHDHLCFGRNLKTNRGIRKIYGRKRDYFGYFIYVLIRGCWHWASEGRLPEVGPLSHWLGVHIWLSLVSPKLEVKTKN